MELFDYAKQYRDKGLSVIPVGKDKKPLINWKDYQHKFATDKELESWFKDTGLFGVIPNIGIITGKISGITVVDVEKGGKIGDLPKTLVAKTGGGGFHLYYTYTPGVQNLVRIRELTDVRNDGGYVIAPPSETDKGEYIWANKEKRTSFPFKELNISPTTKNKESKQEIVIPEYPGCEEGGRNDMMARYIGKILPLIHPLDWETSGWDKILKANDKNKPPLPLQEVQSIFNSIKKREKQNPSIRKSIPIIEDDTQDDDILLISEVAKRQSTKDLLTFQTGFKKFDDSMLGGFKEGDLIVITAPTGQGKTTFAQTLSCNVARRNTPVLFFSYEVLIENIWKKFQEMGLKDDSVIYSPLKISSNTMDWLETQIRKGIEKYGIKIVVLDHLGFLLPNKQKYDSSLNQNYSAYLGGICRDLKTLALKNKLIVLLLAHTRKTDKPTLNDIRDSSAIAQEADHVFILERLLLEKRRKGRYDDEDIEDDMDESIYSPFTKIKMAKNRLTGLSPIIKCGIVNSKFQEDYATDISVSNEDNELDELL